jgi:hypothetical protein
MSTARLVDIRLHCQPGKEGDLLVFSYQLENLGLADLYVMDAVATIDGASGEARPDFQSVVVAGAADDAVIGKFMAPLPTDRRMAMPVLPLARSLPANARFEGRIEVPLPLAEASPYFADLPLRQYEMVEIQAVTFSIAYWMDGADGLTARRLENARELFAITTRNTLRSVRRISQSLPTRSLQLLKRTDQFPRTIPGRDELTEG